MGLTSFFNMCPLSSLFIYFRFYINSIPLKVPVRGFEPQFSGVVSGCYTNCTTTTGNALNLPWGRNYLNDVLSIILFQATEKPSPILSPPPNGISPRKLHKKFGKFFPPPSSVRPDQAATESTNGLADSPTPVKEPAAVGEFQQPRCLN